MIQKHLRAVNTLKLGCELSVTTCAQCLCTEMYKSLELSELSSDA